MWIDCLKELIIWNMVELSNSVDISSMKSALVGPTCGSKAFQIYLDDAKDSSQESRVKTSFKESKSRSIKNQDSSEDSREDSRYARTSRKASR